MCNQPMMQKEALQYFSHRNLQNNGEREEVKKREEPAAVRLQDLWQLLLSLTCNLTVAINPK